MMQLLMYVFQNIEYRTGKHRKFWVSVISERYVAARYAKLLEMYIIQVLDRIKLIHIILKEHDYMSPYCDSILSGSDVAFWFGSLEITCGIPSSVFGSAGIFAGCVPSFGLL